MQFDNLTAASYQLPGGTYIAASASNVVVADAVYTDNTDAREQIDQLLRQAKISFDTPPSGYSVTTNDDGESILVKTPSVKTLWNATRAASADNTAANVDVAAVAGKKHYLTGFDVQVSAGGAEVTVVDDPATTNTVLWTGYVAAGAPLSVRFDTPLKTATANEVLRLAVAAAGAGNFSYAAAQGYTQ